MSEQPFLLTYAIHATIDVDWEIAIRKAYGVAPLPANQLEAPKNGGESVLDVEAVPAVEAKP